MLKGRPTLLELRALSAKGSQPPAKSGEESRGCREASKGDTGKDVNRLAIKCTPRPCAAVYTGSGVDGSMASLSKGARQGENRGIEAGQVSAKVHMARSALASKFALRAPPP